MTVLFGRRGRAHQSIRICRGWVGRTHARPHWPTLSVPNTFYINHGARAEQVYDIIIIRTVSIRVNIYIYIGGWEGRVFRIIISSADRSASDEYDFFFFHAFSPREIVSTVRYFRGPILFVV